MRKKELVATIARKTGIEQKTVNETVQAYMDFVKKNMLNGENVYFTRFGSFVLKKRATRPARNINTSAQIVVPAHYVPTFKPVQKFVREVVSNVFENSKGEVVSMMK